MTPRLLLLLLAASAVTTSTAMAAPADDLIAADKAFSKISVAQGSNAAFLAYMTNDAQLFGDGSQPPMHSKAEAAERFKTSDNGDPKSNILRREPDHASTSTDGTQGFTDGHWIFDGGGGKLHLTGHYLTVWKKDATGTWKIAADMGTTDPQPN